MRKEPEPLSELLQQQFPRKDPVELEQITKPVQKWLEQKRQYYSKESNRVTRKFGENHIATQVIKVYPRCVENLLREIDPQNYPIHT